MNERFKLPKALKRIAEARTSLAVRYAATNLSFSLDGKLVGDIGEAVAWEHYGLRICGQRAGIDGYVGQKSVQIKASASGRGGAFRWLEQNADHLLVFCINFDDCYADLIFDGPQRYVIKEKFLGQRSVSRSVLLELNAQVRDDERLRLITSSAR